MDWNLIRSFAAVAESGSLVAASRTLGVSQPTLGRHIDELERLTGLTLFIRGRSGMLLTEGGLNLFEEAKAMRAEADRFQLKAVGQSMNAKGTVRITASEVVATYMLPSILAALQDEEPDIDIELVPSNSVADLLTRDADIAVRMIRPVQNDVIAAKVNDMAMGTYAHRSYLEKHGRPRSVSDLFSHRIVGLDRDDLILRRMADMGIKAERGMFSLRTDDQVTAWELIRAGAGIGFGPRWLARKDENLVRIVEDMAIEPLPMWLAAHQELRTSLKIRRVQDFLHAALSALPLIG